MLVGAAANNNNSDALTTQAFAVAAVDDGICLTVSQQKHDLRVLEDRRKREKVGLYPRASARQLPVPPGVVQVADWYVS